MVRERNGSTSLHADVMLTGAWCCLCAVMGLHPGPGLGAQLRFPQGDSWAPRWSILSSLLPERQARLAPSGAWGCCTLSIRRLGLRAQGAGRVPFRFERSSRTRESRRRDRNSWNLPTMPRSGIFPWRLHTPPKSQRVSLHFGPRESGRKRRYPPNRSRMLPGSSFPSPPRLPANWFATHAIPANPFSRGSCAPQPGLL